MFTGDVTNEFVLDNFTYLTLSLSLREVGGREGLRHVGIVDERGERSLAKTGHHPSTFRHQQFHQEQAKNRQMQNGVLARCSNCINGLIT